MFNAQIYLIYFYKLESTKGLEMLAPLAVAIVSSSNCPLFIRTCYDTTNKDEATKLVYLLHASLDIVHERAEEPQVRECFLGVLYLGEQFKIFGHLSVTKVKVLILFNNLISLKENEVRVMLKSIHKQYVDVTSMNPFYKPNEIIKSKKLNEFLASIFTSEPIADQFQNQLNLQERTSPHMQVSGTLVQTV